MHRGTNIMTHRKPAKRVGASVLPRRQPVTLLADLRELILNAREGVARAVDAGLTTLYWNIGQRIRRDILKEKRAGYGDRIGFALSAQVEAECGPGFGERRHF